MNEVSRGLDWRRRQNKFGQGENTIGEGEKEGGRLTREEKEEEEKEAGGKAAKRKWDVMNGGRQGASRRK